MALPKSYTNNYGKISQILEKMREGTAPERYNRQYLKDHGFKSSHDFAFIQVLKELGFLTQDGAPTGVYMKYLDKSQHRKVIGSAVSEAYRDIFTLKAKPTKADLSVIEGKFKSEFNSSDAVAKTRANTFLALLEQGDFGAEVTPAEAPIEEASSVQEDVTVEFKQAAKSEAPSFHYNIQIHLPPSKDIEVYNAIFKSLKEHIIDD